MRLHERDRKRRGRVPLRVFGLAVALSCLPASAAGQQAGLTLQTVYAEARARNPALRAAEAVADAAAARVETAGTLPDPAIQVGIMNFGVPGLETNMPMSMAPSVQAVQRVPFPGKLGLSERIARQSTEMARAAASERWWQVRTRVADAFYGLYEMDRKLEVMRQTQGLLRDFEQVARAMYGSGSGHQSDVLRAGVEIARMDADIRRMEALRAAGAARLNAALDRPAGTAIPAVVYEPLPLAAPPRDTLAAWAEASRPALEGSRLGVERADTRQQLADRQIWPDFTVGLQYGQRPGSDGTVRMGSVLLGFTVPIHAGRRQLREREAAAAMARAAEADLVSERTQVDARISELVAELDRARTLVHLYRADVLPQARADVTSSLASYRVGSIDFMTLVDAQISLNRYRQELYALLADYGRAVARLEGAIGRVLPRTNETLAEVHP